MCMLYNTYIISYIYININIYRIVICIEMHYVC